MYYSNQIHSSRPRKWKRKNLKSVKNNAESTDKEKMKMKKVKVQEIYPKIEIIGWGYGKLVLCFLLELNIRNAALNVDREENYANR